MATSPNLSLTLLADNQNGAEILVNEAILVLDCIIGGGQIIEATAPPGTPVNGDKRLVIATATGVFAGQEGKLALYWDTVWKFYDIPLPNHWSTTQEVKTGRYEDGEDIFRKSFIIAAGPNGLSAPTTVTQAHGVGTIKLNKPLRLLATIDNGTTSQFCTSGWLDEITFTGFTLFVNATNILWRAFGIDMSGYAARVILEYAK